MSLEELNLHVDNSHELSRDAMLEKIILLSVSYFCVGTELRFLSKQASGKNPKHISDDPDETPESKKYLLEDSEMWHAMALETCGTFLPSECPLVSHMIISFQKHHSPSMTTIPEDSLLTEDITVLRPLNEVKMDSINYHQMLKKYDLKPKPDTKQQADAKKSKQMKLSTKGYQIAAIKSKRDRPMSSKGGMLSKLPPKTKASLVESTPKAGTNKVF